MSNKDYQGRDSAFWVSSILGGIAGLSLWLPIELLMTAEPFRLGWLWFFVPATYVGWRIHLSEWGDELYLKKGAEKTMGYQLGQFSPEEAGMIIDSNPPHASLRSWGITCLWVVSLHVYSFYIPHNLTDGQVGIIITPLFMALFFYNKWKNLVPSNTRLCLI